MFPERRMRRLRSGAATRTLFAEADVRASDLVYPIFVEHRDEAVPIGSMPGIERLPVESAVKEAKEVEELGVPAVLLFGVPEEKDDAGSSAWSEGEAVQEALRRMGEETELVLMADTCLCEYTSHGHCGPLNGGTAPDNDATLEALERVALSQASAGADFVSPSGMMDGMVQAVRSALDDGGFGEVGVMSYSAKYASGFYGPFREAAGSGFEGHRGGYQIQPSQRREAQVENLLDYEEGADVLMVKPAMPYLDVIRETRQRFDLPLAAYQVSGEYSMLAGAVENGLLPGEAVVESLLSVKRAGADVVITYFAKEVAESGQVA
ncbi:MAG: hypothetical protein MAG715_01367 [Methanonatronarchaeales archaeon]|nr:hypothetical protein [Methanonatronarchaeales archaeon]